MQELLNDDFYRLIKHYIDTVIDYHIIKDDDVYQEIESHKKAVKFVLDKDGYNYDINKALLKEMSKEELFNTQNKEDFTYYYAFTNTPYGKPDRIIVENSDKNSNDDVYKKIYNEEDFNIVNNVLFPNGLDDLIIYKWSNDWSEYFDDGNEWWGSACWSIYDKSMDRFIIIMVTVTD